MTDKEKQIQLSRYRLKQAAESINEAVCLLSGLQDTLECLESVFQLDYPSVEVIVVDNGSADNSVEVIRNTYPQVTLIENKENLGYTGGNNIAMRHAIERGADYMWLFNNDTVVEPDTLNKLVISGSISASGLVLTG